MVDAPGFRIVRRTAVETAAWVAWRRGPRLWDIRSARTCVGQFNDGLGWLLDLHAWGLYRRRRRCDQGNDPHYTARRNRRNRWLLLRRCGGCDQCVDLAAFVLLIAHVAKPKSLHISASANLVLTIQTSAPTDRLWPLCASRDRHRL